MSMLSKFSITSFGKSFGSWAPKKQRDIPSIVTEKTVLILSCEPYRDKVGRPTTVTPPISYSPGPPITKGFLSPKVTDSTPFMSSWLRPTHAISAPNRAGLCFDCFEMGLKAKTVFPNWTLTNSMPWYEIIITLVYRKSYGVQTTVQNQARSATKISILFVVCRRILNTKYCILVNRPCFSPKKAYTRLY